MNITKVKYERLFPIGMYLNEKIGFEADIDTMLDTDQPNIAIEKLRQLAEDIHKEKYPHYYQENNPVDIGVYENFQRVSTIPLVEKKDIEEILTKDEKVDGMKTLINLCTTKQLLERQRGQVERLANEEVTKLFEEKLKSFE